MSILVFTGPTLPAEEGRRELEATYLPPAAQGDVYRAALERPWAIGLIDGYFEQVPSVWHKEILWALSQGIHVFGSASMGALRAAELAAFGMEGVGVIYEAFRSGELQADDEVAVTHAPEEDGYRALSEAMVNIRSTLRAAEAAGVVSPLTRAGLERMGRELFYAERAYPVLLAHAEREGLPRGELEALRAWLLRGRVNQKREDALAMLRAMRERRAVEPGPKRVLFTFEHTDAWEALRRRVAQGGRETGGGEEEGVLEELRLTGRYGAVVRGVLGRVLALEEARRHGKRSDAQGLRRLEVDVRGERGLASREALERWLEENGVEDFQRLLRDEADVRWVQALYEADVERSLPDHLRMTGEYGALRERAREKRRVLGERGWERPGLEQAGVTEEALWRWYFGTRLGSPVPADLEQHARASGFADVGALRGAVLREWLYMRHREGEAPRL